MRTAKVAISIDMQILGKLDNLVKKHIFPSRSKAIQEAVSDKILKIERSRLAKECSKLDKTFERALANENIDNEASEWPEY